MPSRPDFSQHRPDPRFDRYRDRVGRLYRGEENAGFVLVVVVRVAPQVGGHLWWKRFGSTRDWLFEWTVVDGDYSDMLVPEDTAGKVVADYDSGRFNYSGEVLRVGWTDGAESERLRRLKFGK